MIQVQLTKRKQGEDRYGKVMLHLLQLFQKEKLLRNQWDQDEPQPGHELVIQMMDIQGTMAALTIEMSLVWIKHPTDFYFRDILIVFTPNIIRNTFVIYYDFDRWLLMVA